MSVEAGPNAWSRRRWVFAIALVFAIQIGALFLLRDRRSLPVRRVVDTSMLGLATEPPELQALNDPTLLALPHREGFSGEAWLKTKPMDFHPADRSEPPRLLAVPGQELGAEFRKFVRSGPPVGFQTLVMPPPEENLPGLPPVAPLSTGSTLRVEGELRQRRLLSQFELPSMTNADLVLASEVRVVVKPAGDVLSAVLLPKPGGLKEADELALQLARNARFDSIEPAGPGRQRSPMPESMLGTLIFQWHTLPLPPTNAPPATQ